MKHRLALLAIIAFFIITVAKSQTHYEGNISIGAKAGATLSRMQFNPTVPQSFITGFLVGGTIRYVEERHFGLIGEINIEQRGWKEKYEGYDYAFQRRLTYLQIPLLTHIYFGSNKFHGFFNAGPEIGYMIGESTSSNFDYSNVSTITDFPSTNRTLDQYTLDIQNKFDYGISAGLGMEFIAGNRNSFTFEGRFYYGLGDIFGNHKKDTFSSSSGMSIMITLGYMYRIK